VTAPAAPGGRRVVFGDVDADHVEELVAMMGATDRWPGVRAARSWVLDRAAVGPASLVVDVGCGPGTFGAEARSRGARTLELDRSAAMAGAARGRHPDAVVARADLGQLPVADGMADLVRVERVLQWVDDPVVALAELLRVTAPGGWLALTDTDWGTFAVDHPDPAAIDRLSASALAWVPHPRLARTLARRLLDAGAVDVDVHTEAVVLSAWDPDDPRQLDGPPGLPLHTIGAAGPTLTGDLDVLAALARRGRFFATLTLVTAIGRRA
jgi:SAM-dependent methyltransferase